MQKSKFNDIAGRRETCRAFGKPSAAEGDVSFSRFSSNVSRCYTIMN